MPAPPPAGGGAGTGLLSRRLLRNLGLVVGERRGRSVVYALHDHHVAELLDQAVYHVEHLRLGISDAAD
ncbi:hypothetical protein SVIOM74S_09791 [Streptomyces violarus]